MLTHYQTNVPRIKRLVCVPTVKPVFAGNRNVKCVNQSWLLARKEVCFLSRSVLAADLRMIAGRFAHASTSAAAAHGMYVLKQICIIYSKASY
ncbi:hypothetical protein KP79_PYT16148 [Mizuhopecten yessoensis]|uniref:Uncharacterized protein n=1 Tax=Mizuhopecten yessoensis TaxID=6573 RepID=A0A210PVC3_MIZYE|nr:hypothetical protein KP79_PYT16148 [Mizuhopecten yessoensis]